MAEKALQAAEELIALDPVEEDETPAGAQAEGAKKKNKKKNKKAKGPEPEKIHVAKYKRGSSVNTKDIEDKKLKGNLTKFDKQARKNAYEAARAEILLPEEAGYLEAEGMEKTFKFTQSQLAAHVDVASAKKMFDLDLEKFGPYSLDYTQNGRHLLIGGRKGHVATFDWQTGTLGCELHLMETVRDVQWLHNETMFAVAQQRQVYLYDNTGTEVFSLDKHIDPLKLEFLRYHFLLASVGNAGYLKYHDVSTGKLVVELRTRLGPCHAMKQNPWNAVLHLGHTNGVVTLWTPNMSTPVVKQLCHKGPVQSLAVDHRGQYMATSGLDGQLKIWDIRNFKDQPLYEYYTPTPASALDFSQRGLLSVTHGPHVQIWKDIYMSKQQAPYMSHLVPGSAMEDCKFVPFEDVLGLGHRKGITSIVIPGAGEPNFDSYEANPYQSLKQRQESEVKALLDKVPAELISLDPNAILHINSYSAAAKKEDDERRSKEKAEQKFEPKHRMRGKSSSQRRYLRKQTNVIDQAKEDKKARIAKEKQLREQERQEKINGPQKKTALDRFMK